MKDKKVYINSIVQFRMFILVSMPLGLVTGGLSGPPWGTFWFWSGLMKSLSVQCTLCSTGRNQKIKKTKHGYLPFFIRKVAMIAELPVGGLK